MKLTASKISDYKRDGRKIAMLTVYDYAGARILDEAGIDVLLVGDSMGNVVQGKSTTLPVTLDEIIYHAEIVTRAVRRALVVVDLPFPYCQLGVSEAIRAAARIFKETEADAVKVEGGSKRAATVAAIIDAGIPVMGHCGLLPQNIHLAGGFFIQRQREELLCDVKAIESAGAFAILVECLTPEIAKEATAVLRVPTIGIGSGGECDGQVLVFHDVFGYIPPEKERPPKHVRQYADLRTIVTEAAKNYINDVHNSTFIIKPNTNND
ncbi:MAG: 3-methyl-2-oxobutanoate hydroxymethyltransferase [Planctomycetaceae bacterium]|jgi:3-methyl-2-oxobutanoate hydroxymethyltransferase|nr:3-methyl-2-oxobutanoate hydroxymethyltransferase [Planctomycetaceae bacterium]